MVIRPFQHTVPPRTFSSFADVTAWCRQMYDAFLRARQGKMDCVTEITLTNGATSTTLNDIRLTNQSVVTFDPKSAASATELYGGTMYVDEANRGTGSWVITHSNGATTRKFQISIIG